MELEQEQSIFFDKLSPELRNLVYEYACSHVNIVVLNLSINRVPIIHPFAQTCTKIYDEFAGVLEGVKWEYATIVRDHATNFKVTDYEGIRTWRAKVMPPNEDHDIRMGLDPSDHHGLMDFLQPKAVPRLYYAQVTLTHNFDKVLRNNVTELYWAVVDPDMAPCRIDMDLWPDNYLHFDYGALGRYMDKYWSDYGGKAGKLDALALRDYGKIETLDSLVRGRIKSLVDFHIEKFPKYMRRRRAHFAKEKKREEKREQKRKGSKGVKGRKQ